jgi:RNA polymerase sigma-70 factor (ECF subfamily)
MPAAVTTSLRRPSPAATTVDASLLASARDGNPTALGRIYELTQHRVRRFARRLLGDDAAAEDLVQDVYTHLPRLLGRYRGDGPFETFLLGEFARRARRHLRTAVRRRRLHDRFALCADASPSTPETDTSRRELAAMLVRALDGLSREHRLAFVLREVEGLSAAEAAVVAGVPEATIRTRVFHARRKLQAELGRLGVA